MQDSIPGLEDHDLGWRPRVSKECASPSPSVPPPTRALSPSLSQITKIFKKNK